MISVLVVDDSVVVRRLVTDALADDPEIRVIGTAPNGRIALAKLDQLAPDVVTLDVEMPVMDGLATLREIRRSRPRLPVIMFSTLTSAGASATLDALAAGASDYVTKPANVGSVAESVRKVQEQLIPRIRALCGRRPSSIAPGTTGLIRPASPLAGEPRPAAARTGRIEVVAIGCSTGGPEALSRVIRALPAGLATPIVVVQHMPPVFTKMFADRLDRTAPLRVVEAVAETPLAPGTVYIAPGDFHLEVVRRGAAIVSRLSSGPPENFCRPAVDVLFRSVATAYGGAALGIVLTGMGQDGKRGSEQMRAAGAEIVAQDEASSVVWGMPGAVVGAGLADVVLPLDDMANHLITRTAFGRGARSLEVTR